MQHGDALGVVVPQQTHCDRESLGSVATDHVWPFIEMHNVGLG